VLPYSSTLFTSPCIWCETINLEKTYSQAFMRIFKTFDKNIILNCQYYMGILPIKLVLGQRKLIFLSKMKFLNKQLFYVL